MWAEPEGEHQALEVSVAFKFIMQCLKSNNYVPVCGLEWKGGWAGETDALRTSPHEKMREPCFKEKQHSVTLGKNRVSESFRWGFKSWLCSWSTVDRGIGC